MNTVTTLHDRLVAAVEERRRVAESAASACWHADYCDDEARDFHDANDPTAVLRHCERDLKVLKRHWRYTDTTTQFTHTGCDWCGNDWPCAEIEDLAAAYDVGLSTPDTEETP